MSYVNHDPGHRRLVAALKRLPRNYRDRVNAQLDRIDLCNTAPLGKISGNTYEAVQTLKGEHIHSGGWHCNSPLCHRACVSKSEKNYEKYLPRAISRVKFEYYALTLTSVPDPSLSLRDSYWVVEKARRHLFKLPEVKKVMRGGLWRVEITAGNRVVNPEIGEQRSWFIHVHILADANFNPKRKKRLEYLWGKCLEAEGGEIPESTYNEPVERMDAYIRYLRKELDYSKWTDDELGEACKFFMSVRAPVMFSAFGSWSDKTREGRPYAREKIKFAKEIKLAPKKEMPEIDFSDVKIVTHVTEEHKKEVILGIYPAVRGHGMEIKQAAQAEIISGIVNNLFKKLRLFIKMNQEVIGITTGTVYRLGDIIPNKNVGAGNKSVYIFKEYKRDPDEAIPRMCGCIDTGQQNAGLPGS